MKILAQIIACIVFGTILGVVFWLCDGGKARPEVSGGQEGASQAQEYEINGTSSTSGKVNIAGYDDVLIHLKRKPNNMGTYTSAGTYTIRLYTQGVLDEIRVTRGVWHKDFLEVIK